MGNEIIFDRPRDEDWNGDEYAAHRIASALRKTGLTPRQLDFIRLVATGDTNVQIARKLFVAEETVKTHLVQIRAKLEAANRAHLVAQAYRVGLLP